MIFRSNTTEAHFPVRLSSSYKGTSASIFRVDLIEPVGILSWCGVDDCIDISDPFLAISTVPEITSVADRLGLDC